MNPRPQPQHLEMDPRAGDFLELLRDLGHLDDAGIERLSSELMAELRPGRVVTYDEVRRAAARMLFEGEARLRSDQRDLLDAEWARLFF